MVGIIPKPDTRRKLQILSQDAQYDLACACSADTGNNRKRGADGKWVYPVTLPNGGKNYLFKTLLSNVCTNDCKYCPLRSEANIRRCSLEPEETVNIFLDYLRRKKVFGLFLSSGVIGSADAAMNKLSAVAQILRTRHRFGGYIHLKIIPGCSDAAIEQAVSLADTVSLNIETPGEANLQKLSSRKNYLTDIIEPMKLIRKLTAPGSKYAKTCQTTQFIVGAAGEKDAGIVKYTAALYKRMRMHRVYFSSYQRELGRNSLPGEGIISDNPQDAFMREHRLYQVDFLLRKYGFDGSEIVFNEDGNLSLSVDPKETWAKKHPEFFPVRVNCASKFALLRVPGLGLVTVSRILQRRRQGRIRSIEDIGRFTARLAKAKEYLVF